MAYLHHVLIHFPVALGLAAAVFVLLSWIRPTGPWEAAARALAYMAALAAVAAAVTGWFASGHVAEMGGDVEAVRRHQNVALPAAIALVVAALGTWGSVCSENKRAGKVAGVVSILAAIAVGYGAHLGGDMLHPGLAPWSTAEHRHAPGPENSAMPEGHQETGAGTMHPGHDINPPEATMQPEATQQSAPGSAAEDPMLAEHNMHDAGAPAHPSAVAPPVTRRARSDIQPTGPNPGPVSPPATIPSLASPPPTPAATVHGDHGHSED